MQRRRVEGPPERVFAAMQSRLAELGASPRLVDPSSITLLFEIDAEGRGPPFMFFLAVVPTDETHSDVAIARKRKGRREDFRAMIVGEEDPIESRMLDRLLASAAR